MQRELFGEPIHQRSDNQFLSMTDLVRVGNAWRFKNGFNNFDYTVYFRNKSTKEFCQELEKKYGKIKISGNGRGTHTWLHPILWIDIALSISPEIKIQTYQWLYDNLINFRNYSGDSYKKMCGALFVRSTKPSTFALEIANIADRIRIHLGVNDWQTANEEQLRKRDQIHEAISLLSEVLKNNNYAVNLALEKY